MDNTINKICNKCGIAKSLSGFHDRKGASDGKRNECKLCKAEYSKLWRRANADEIAIDKKLWAQNNQDKVKKIRQRYITNHPDRVIESRWRYCKSHPDKLREKQNRYVRTHPREVADLLKRWKKANPHRVAIHRERYHKNNPEIVPIRLSPRYKQWRLDVLERDNWTCQTCRIKGVKLEVHHCKKSFVYIIREYNIKTLEQAMKCNELWDLSNGETLCETCHDLTRQTIDKAEQPNVIQSSTQTVR